MTISEIAKLAGVSSAAVSRYLNDGSLSQEKRQRIERVIRETKYRPSEYARTMRTKKSNRIGVLVPQIFRVGAEDIIRHLRTYGSEELSRIADEFKSESGKRNRDSGNL